MLRSQTMNLVPVQGYSDDAQACVHCPGPLASPAVSCVCLCVLVCMLYMCLVNSLAIRRTAEIDRAIFHCWFFIFCRVYARVCIVRRLWNFPTIFDYTIIDGLLYTYNNSIYSYVHTRYNDLRLVAVCREKATAIFVLFSLK